MAFDRETQEAINRISERAGSMTPEIAQQQLTEGMDQKGFLQSGLQKQQRSLTGDTGLLSKALQNKVSRDYDIGLNRAQRLAQSEAQLRPYQDLDRAAKMRAKEISSINQDSAISRMKYNLAKQKEAKEKEARASTLGSILGVGGAVVGGVLGGPAGAAAGGSIGSAGGRMAVGNG